MQIANSARRLLGKLAAVLTGFLFLTCQTPGTPSASADDAASSTNVEIQPNASPPPIQTTDTPASLPLFTFGQTNEEDLSVNFGLGSGGIPDLVPLAAWWKFDEGTGANAADSSGNGNTGTLTNGPAWIAGAFSNALQFIPTNEQKVVVYPSGAVTGSFTISVWVLPEAAMATNAIISTRAEGVSTFDLKLFNGNEIYADIGNGATWIKEPAVAGYAYSTWVWQHIAYVVTPTNFLIYANGVYQGGGSYATSAPVLYNASYGSTLIIGNQWNGTEQFNGGIDDLRIYNCALSSNDVADLYNKPDTVGDGIPNSWRAQYFGGEGLTTNSDSCAACDPDGDGYNSLQEYNFGTDPTNSVSFPTNIPPHLVAWWAFDEGTGTITYDSSGNENAGVAIDSPPWVTGMFSNALQFIPANNQVVSLQPSGSVTGTFTVAAWVLPEDTNATLTFISTRATGISTFDLKLINQHIYSDIGYGDNWILTSAAVPFNYTTGVWYHIAYVVTPTNCLIYANGDFLGKSNYPAAMPVLFDPDSNSALNIGNQWNGTEQFNGTLDDVRIYSRALSNSEVAALYNADSFNDGIPNWWRQQYFGSGSTTNNRTCASCFYTNSPLNNLQDYGCGFDPRVPIVLTTPGHVYSGMTGYVASVSGVGTNATYSWSITNGTITAGQGTTAITWNAGGTGAVVACVLLSNSGSCNVEICTNITATQAYYVDYQGGSDSFINGTNASSPWKHSPGDQNAGVGPGNKILQPGDTVFFRGGESYVITTTNTSPTVRPYAGGIVLRSGSASSPITYDGFTWAGTNVTVTDNYSSNQVVAFTSFGGLSDVIIKGFNFGPIGGTSTLPTNNGVEIWPKAGYGIWAGVSNGAPHSAPCTNVAILNCNFSELGYWQNSKPLGPESNSGGTDQYPDFPAYNPPPGGQSLNSPAGIQADGWVNCIISNCTFTKVHTGIELSYISSNISNLTVTACDIHDYIVWGIDLASSPLSACADYIYIHDNKIHDIGWAYGAGWSGYTNAIGDSTYHQDPIFHRIGSGCGTNTVWPITAAVCPPGCNGTNIDIYNNTFYDSGHTNSAATAYISLTGGVSANIYNNLFNLPNFNLFIYRNIDDIPTSNSTVRILQNTFVQNLTNWNQLISIEWNTQGLSNIWSSLHNVLVEGNIFYDYAVSPLDLNSQGLGSTYFYTWSETNIVVCTNVWSFDYNVYRSQDTSGFANWPVTDGGQGGVPWMQSLGWDSNSSTSDPVFFNASNCGTNAVSNDYRLQAGSPAIGAGPPLATLQALGLPGITNDITGKPRTNYNGRVDAGAYRH